MLWNNLIQNLIRISTDFFPAQEIKLSRGKKTSLKLCTQSSLGHVMNQKNENQTNESTNKTSVSQTGRQTDRHNLALTLVPASENN